VVKRAQPDDGGPVILAISEIMVCFYVGIFAVDEFRIDWPVDAIKSLSDAELTT
jgi:hypothetical protein